MRPSIEKLLSKTERGQALVEMALMVVVLVLLLSGVLDLGRAYYAYLALKDAAGEGAYFGSVYPSWADASDCLNPWNIEFRVRNAAPSGGLIDWNGPTTYVTTTVVSVSATELITVAVTTDYTLAAPFIGAIAGSQTLPLTAVSTARILAPPATTCPP